MAGARNRCFYCSDSLGTDVEHFEPITVSPASTFSWRNLQWVCTNCNRHKGNRPTAAERLLMIDPTMVDPWAFLTLDEATGLVAARYEDGALDACGEFTLRVLTPLTEEGVITGRERAITSLRSAVSAVQTDPSDFEARRAFRAAVQKDDYGVSAWFALWEGARSEPFAALRRDCPAVWRRFVAWTLASRLG